MDAKRINKLLQADRIADAILRLLNWQSRQLEMKHQRKIRNMLRSSYRKIRSPY